MSSLPEVVFVPDSVLADPGRDEAGGRHVKGRVPHTEAVTQLKAREEFPRRPLLYRDVASIWTASVQSGHGHTDVKRNPDHHHVITFRYLYLTQGDLEEGRKRLKHKIEVSDLR